MVEPAGRDAAVELRAVAPLLAGGKVIGPCTFVTSGAQTVGVTSSELLRRHDGKPLTIATKFDGSAAIPVKAWSMGRYSGIGLVELGAAIPDDHDLQPLSISAVCATVDTRGAPAALVTFTGSSRVVIPVYVDAVGGMDVITRLASPQTPTTAAFEGAPLFAWFPPNPALGRKREVLVLAVGYTYRAQTFKPRELPALVELMGLDDLGRAISWGNSEERVEQQQVAGEIVRPDS